MPRIGEMVESRRPISRCDLDRHGVAAVRVGADRQRLEFERPQIADLAGTDIGIERRLVFAGVAAAARRVAADDGPRRLQRQLVEPARQFAR